MESRTVKIELPLPRLPESIAFRYSIRTFLLLVSLCAFGFAIYSRGRRVERARHMNGEFHLVLSSPGYAESNNRLCADYLSTLMLIRASDIDIALARTLWPPKAWIKRVDWQAGDLEQTIPLQVSGTLEEPDISPVISIERGDRIFIAFEAEPAKQTSLGFGRQTTTGYTTAQPR